MAPTPEELHAAAAALKAGALVAFPTETVYGLGAHALDPQAVAQIFEAKGRPHFDPLIVHIAEAEQLEQIAQDPSGRAQQLAEAFWPGPLTLVLAKKPCVPDLVTAGHASVAVRVPAHPVAQSLLRRANIPVAAPSANRFGGVSPTRAEHVRGQLDVDIVLDGGPCGVGVESTIISLLDTQATLLRAGGLALEAIEEIVGPVHIPAERQLVTLSPGRQTRHYATGVPLTLTSTPRPTGPRCGLLTLGPPQTPQIWAQVEVLSHTSDLTEAAANLFAAMRRLDAAGLDQIFATPVPEVGLGRAIMDRLRRAQTR